MTRIQTNLTTWKSSASLCLLTGYLRAPNARSVFTGRPVARRLFCGRPITSAPFSLVCCFCRCILCCAQARGGLTGSSETITVRESPYLLNPAKRRAGTKRNRARGNGREGKVNEIRERLKRCTFTRVGYVPCCVALASLQGWPDRAAVSSS